MEVCVEYIESAINAEKGGGIRLELCSALSEGGLTPSVGLLKIIKSKVKIPVYVMIRPRTGNDFVYSDDELTIMENDIEIFNKYGADGFVFGVLTQDRKVDKVACARLMKKTEGKPVTFHRAFDMTSDPKQAINDIISSGFKKLLTSGQESSALKGANLIKDLIISFKSQITIMPGCGVNANNLHDILSITNANEFHGTGRSPVVKTTSKTSVMLGHTDDESTLYITNTDKIKQMTSIYKELIKEKI